MIQRLGLLVLAVGCSATWLCAEVVLPGVATNLVCYYDFEHPVATDPAEELDLGFSGTKIQLVNGGAAMRIEGGAHAASLHCLQTQQFNPATRGNDDWKAGVYEANGLTSLHAFSAVSGITMMGWVKPTGTNPNLNSETATPGDFYNAIGLFGLLSGNSDGHNVRALLEIIDVSGTLRLVALGRRIDSGSSLTLAATNDWHALLPDNVWTHLAATFDYDNGTMALYRNGGPLFAQDTTTADAWGVVGGVEPDVTSATDPAGIKIGGSFPQNTAEKNAFNGCFDDLMFFNKVLSPAEVAAQYDRFLNASPVLTFRRTGLQFTLSWPLSAGAFGLERRTNSSGGAWFGVPDLVVTNGAKNSVTLPIIGAQQFFRLKKR